MGSVVPSDLAEWLSLSQAAAILEVTPQWFHASLSEGIRTFDVATGRLYNRDDVEQLKQQRAARKSKQ